MDMYFWCSSSRKEKKKNLCVKNEKKKWCRKLAGLLPSCVTMQLLCCDVVGWKAVGLGYECVTIQPLYCDRGKSRLGVVLQ